MAAHLSPAALLLRSGAPRDYPISGAEIWLGFEKSNDVRIQLEGVSRRHAKITFDGHEYWIEDTGSSNGTFLNGIPVVHKERLRHLDIVTLGRRAELVFVRKAVATRRTRRRGILAAWLETVDGPEAGEKREIPRGAITLGRSPSANVVVSSQLVSKAHARLERSGLELVLMDLQSANGTFVEGKPIVTLVLQDGDEFSLGKGRTFRVRIEAGEIETADVARAPAVDTTLGRGLPLDWKTRMEWTPEEKAVFERARADSAAPTGSALQAPPKPTVAVAPPIVARPAATAQTVSTPPTAAPPAPADPRPARPAASATPPSPSAPREKSVPPGATVPIDSSVSLPRVVLDGPQQFILPAGLHEVGRLTSCKIKIDSPQVSRRHAVLWIGPEEVSLEDLGSANGTWVNDERITAPRRLASGDQIGFGDLRYAVRFLAGGRPAG